MEDYLEIILKYPLIKWKKINEEQTIFEGKLFIHDVDYYISILKTSNNEGNPNFSIDFDKSMFPYNELQSIIDSNKFNRAVTLLDHVKAFYSQKIAPNNRLINYTSIYRRALEEYAEFTKFFLNLKTCSISGDLSQVCVSILDEQNREHCIKIKINHTNSSNEIFEISACDLPENTINNKTTEFFKPNSSLVALFDQFLARIESLQPYFDLMDTFDKNCYIMDPESPKRCPCYRRIWLGDNLSIMVTVDPENVSFIPDIKVIGLEKLVENVRAKINENLINWDQNDGAFDGLLALLELESFPQKTLEENKNIDLLVNDGECSICFCQRLNEKLPEVVCKNDCCKKSYHSECLCEVSHLSTQWLISVNGIRVFNEICGKCPNCEKSITCPLQ